LRPGNVRDRRRWSQARRSRDRSVGERTTRASGSATSLPVPDLAASSSPHSAARPIEPRTPRPVFSRAPPIQLAHSNDW